MVKKLLLFLSFIGILDASYLSYEHYSNTIPPCSLHAVFLADCGKVLTSSYATVFGIPVALFGVVYYTALFILMLLLLIKKQKIFLHITRILVVIGLIASIYFVTLQLFVIQAICFYCMTSALNSFVIFFLALSIKPRIG